MFQGWWIVATHFLAQLFATGFFVYSLPLLIEPVINEFSSDATTVNYLPAAAGLLGLVVAPLTGPLVDRWSAKALLIIGTLCLVIGLLGLSISQSIGQFVVIGAIFLGVANLLMGPMTGSAVVSRWFTATRGRALGIAAIGTSIGGMLMPKALGATIASVGWRVGLQGIAMGVLVIVLPLLVFRFWNQPSDRGLEPEVSEQPAMASMGDGEPASNSEILRKPAFWLFTVSLGLFLATYTASLMNLGQFCADLGLEVTDSSTFLTILATAGILGKLGFGYLADRIPLKLGLLAAMGATASAFIIFSTEPGFAMMCVASALMGFATGGILPVWNAMVPAIFGVQNFGRTMGLMSPGISILVSPAFPIFGAIRDATDSYVLAFQVSLGVLLLAALLVVPLRVGGTPSEA